MGWASLTGGNTAMIVALVAGHVALYRAGLIVVLFGAVVLGLTRTRVAEEMMERARQAGYDDGYSDCASVLRPATLRSMSSGPSLSFRCPPQQLGEQDHVTSAADLVV